MSLRWRQRTDENEVACAPRLFLVRLRQDDVPRVRTWKVDGQRRWVSLHGLVPGSVYHIRIVAVDCDSRSRPSRWVTVRTEPQTATQRHQRDEHHGNLSLHRLPHLSVIDCPHRRHCLVLSCLVRVGGVNTIGDKTRKTVLSCVFNPVFNLQLFSLNILKITLKLEIGYWVETRQNSLVVSVSAVCCNTAQYRHRYLKYFQQLVSCRRLKLSYIVRRLSLCEILAMKQK